MTKRKRKQTPPGPAGEPVPAPKQLRAQDTIRAIVEAAAKVLVNDGWQGFNTNAIAKVAGVSIGSLYQHFKDKDQIAVALVNQKWRDLKKSVARSLRESIMARSPDTIAIAVNAFTDSFLADEGLYFALRSELKGPSRDRIAKIFDDCITFLSFTFVLGRTRLRPHMSSTQAFVIVHAVDGVLAEAHRRRSSPEQLKVLQQELAHLVTRYIKNPTLLT